MHYSHLPPGRKRSIEYSNYLESIRNRNRRRINIHTTPIRNRNIQPFLQISPIINVHHFNRIEMNYESLSQLQDVKIGLLSKNILDKTVVKLNKSCDNFCVICQDDINTDSIIRQINCKHIFHIDCIDNWFVENKKCPTCKYEV